MDAIAEKLDERLQRWEHATAGEVRRRVAEIILRSVEQEVLGKLDDPTVR